MRFLVIILLFLVVKVVAQEVPSDFLSSDFHKTRRDKVRDLMPSNTVLVFFANAERNRANDVDYVYHQDPDFYYLTGYKEPNAVLIIFSDMQNDSMGNSFDELMYVQERDERAEQWNGKRLGVDGVKEVLGFEMVYNGSEFSNIPIDFSTFDKVSFFDFKNDYRDKQGRADLFDLIKTFKIKANYPADYNPVKQQLYTMITATPLVNSANVAQTQGRYLCRYEDLNEDELLCFFLNAKD